MLGQAGGRILINVNIYIYVLIYVLLINISNARHYSRYLLLSFYFRHRRPRRPRRPPRRRIRYGPVRISKSCALRAPCSVDCTSNHSLECPAGHPDTFYSSALTLFVLDTFDVFVRSPRQHAFEPSFHSPSVIDRRQSVHSNSTAQNSG